MGNWDDYQREEREPTTKVSGKLRCVIVDAEEGVSKSSGKPMIIVTVRPSGTNFKVKSWIVKNENFNRNMTVFFDSFPEIREGDFNFLAWVGAEGAANFGEDDQGYLKVKWFLTPMQAANLPPFEGEKPERQEITSLDDGDDEDGLPFI